MSKLTPIECIPLIRVGWLLLRALSEQTQESCLTWVIANGAMTTIIRISEMDSSRSNLRRVGGNGPFDKLYWQRNSSLALPTCKADRVTWCWCIDYDVRSLNEAEFTTIPHTLLVSNHELNTFPLSFSKLRISNCPFFLPMTNLRIEWVIGTSITKMHAASIDVKKRNSSYATRVKKRIQSAKIEWAFGRIFVQLAESYRFHYGQPCQFFRCEKQMNSPFSIISGFLWYLRYLGWNFSKCTFF